jgi:hypothetical protein
MGGLQAPRGSAADRRRLRADVRAGVMASDENEPDEDEADEDEGGPDAASGGLSSTETQPEHPNSTPAPQHPTTSPVATTSSTADTEAPTTTTPPLTTTAPPSISTTTAPTPSPGSTPSPVSSNESLTSESSGALQSTASHDDVGAPGGKSRRDERILLLVSGVLMIHCCGLSRGGREDADDGGHRARHGDSRPDCGPCDVLVRVAQAEAAKSRSQGQKFT